MTFTIRWWMVVIFLFLFPFVYSLFRRPGGDWDFHLDTLAILIGSWLFAVGLTIGKIF